MRAPRPLSILVVECQPEVAGGLADILRAAGYEARTACGAPEALGLLGGWKPDVALLDLVAPGPGTADVATRLRAGREPRPLLIAMAAPGGEGERNGHTRFDIHMAKPVDTERLLKLLDRFA
jgi:CheY-like chemotaxis protein